MSKKQIISNVLFCVMISVIILAGFTLYASTKEDKYPFDTNVVMAKYGDIEIKNIDNIMPNENGEVTIDQLNQIPENAIIGEIDYNGNSVQVIYNCNDASLVEAATMLDRGDFLGEIGCSKIYGYRQNMDSVMQVGVGETVKISLVYGEYEYKCVEKAVVKNDWDAARKNFNVDRGLAIFTDRADEYGFSGEYDVAVFEMVSGPKIVG